MRYLYTLILTVLVPVYSWAQSTVTGTVTDALDGSPLAFVNVAVKGTTAGAITDVDGKYSIKVTGDQADLIFSYIGYNTQTVAVNNRSVVNVSLTADATELESVVVTALGIKREERSLGYAVSEVKSDELENGSSTNIMGALNGKVAGMQVTSTGGGAGSSARVIIRGNAKLFGDNQPLYVVDGVPMSNSQFQNANGGDGGIDTGDGMSAINPDDVESMSVLKGASATALYGSRGINGVVLITTKGGKKTKGLGIDYNFSASFDRINITPDEQNVFAAGSDGSLPINQKGNATNAKENTSMWGPKYSSLNGTYDAFYHQLPMAVEFHDNYKNFFRTGKTFNNSVAISNGNE
ncbi:MAG: TonB-dependent receptor plug domain-containing protein, partial [Cytophagales bacterium]|nr:TonB-dependent receptor plug domain-containing protein [Cytophagales bacterium]